MSNISFHKKKIKITKQFWFSLGILAMFLLLGWFTIFCVKFLVAKFETALYTTDVKTTAVKFDTDGFKKLNLGE